MRKTDGHQNHRGYAKHGVLALDANLTGGEVAKSKYWLKKDQKIYRVVSFNKQAQTVKLKGELGEFETSLEKAINNGYKLLKEQ